MNFEQEIEIDAPIEMVWTVLSGVERWHEWTPTVTGISRLDSSPFGLGCEVMIMQPGLPDAIWKVSEIQEGKYFVWKRGNPLVKVKAAHSVEPVKNHTKVKLSIQFSGIFKKTAARQNKQLIEEYLQLEAKGLKQHCETFKRR